MRVLVIAAHPDDEVLGVGGTICRHTSAGDDVYICMVTKAYEPQWSTEFIEGKTREQREVDQILGIKKRFNLDLPTVRLNTIPTGEFSKKISDVVDSVNPDVVYTHFENDLNYDHTLVFRAALVATRPPKRIKLLCFETLSETEWSYKTFSPNTWVDISYFIKKKIEAFRIYNSEVKMHPHPRSIEGIEILAKKRGMEAYIDYAEAFILVRDAVI